MGGKIKGSILPKREEESWSTNPQRANGMDEKVLQRRSSKDLFPG